MKQSHFTTRRGFIAATGFGVVSLYLLWAGYGAAPLGLGGHAERESESEAAGGGHGGAHGAAGGMSGEEFKRLAQAFAEENKLPDGSVGLRRRAASMEDHAAHGAAPMAEPMTGEAPLDVYLTAYQWGYAPSVLRLEAGVPYRFRMMAVDVAHGASIQLGQGGRIVRLRPNALAEQEITFSRPGEYLLYCTVYCGLAHDRMQGRLIVTAPEVKS